MTQRDVDAIVANTQAYYDGPADEIYRTIWGDNLHLGVPRLRRLTRTPRPWQIPTPSWPKPYPFPRKPASLTSAAATAQPPATSPPTTAAASPEPTSAEKELELARARSHEAGLDALLSFEYGDFHNLPYPDDSYDVVWSQEAFLHAADKNAVLSECRRVLKPHGALIFTDILVRRDTPDAHRARIYDRVKSPDMWDQARLPPRPLRPATQP